MRSTPELAVSDNLNWGGPALLLTYPEVTRLLRYSLVQWNALTSAGSRGCIVFHEGARVASAYSPSSYEFDDCTHFALLDAQGNRI